MEYSQSVQIPLESPVIVFSGYCVSCLPIGYERACGVLDGNSLCIKCLMDELERRLRILRTRRYPSKAKKKKRAKYAKKHV